jgi:DNA-binding SARP family transcriptional activator
VAGVLWTDSSEERAFASLRSALWRIRSRVGYALIDSTKHYVRLTPAVSVDFDEAAELADRLRSQSAAAPLDADWTPLAADLLPGWYDDWILFERERFKNAALEALEALAERLLTEGRFGHALDAALAAVAKDPFRESPQRVVMKAHVAGGNVATAARAYRSYARLLRDELGLDPSAQMQALAAECRIT